MKRRLFSVGAFVVLTFITVGCGPSGSHFKDVKSAVFTGHEKLNKNIELSVGMVPLWIANAVLGFVDKPEAREAREYTQHINKVDVGVYEVQKSMVENFSVVSQRVKARMQDYGFEPVIQVREKNEWVGVFIPIGEEGTIRELFVVVLEKKQVVIVRARGQFEKIAQAAFQNHAHAFPGLQKLFKEGMVL